MQVKGTYQNQGSNAITALTIKWQIDGGTVNTQNLTGINIASYQSQNFTHSVSWTPTTTNAYNLKCWVEAPNGLSDDDTTNDTLTAAITVVSQTIQRLPLLESFTSSTCAPCVAGNNNMKAVLGANPNKWALIKYQMSWPGAGDPYYTLEGGTRRTFYGINSVPALVVEAAPFINSSNFTAAMLNTAYNKAAFVGLVASFDQAGAGKTLDINVTINPVASIPSNNLKLHTAIFEYQTTQNVGSNGETSFDYVMKKMVPDASGTAVAALSDGVAQTKTLSYTFNGNFRLPANASSPTNHAIEHSVEQFFDLGVIVWLQDNVTKEVFQAAYATKTSGIGQVNDGNGIVGLFPNPANETAFLKYQLMSANQVSIAVYDLSGRQILSHNYGKQEQGVYDVNIPTEELSSGLYMVKLQIGNRHFTDKLNIRK
jgi:hypothetical protein